MINEVHFDTWWFRFRLWLLHKLFKLIGHE